MTPALFRFLVVAGPSAVTWLVAAAAIVHGVSRLTPDDFFGQVLAIAFGLGGPNGAGTTTALARGAASYPVGASS